MGIIISLVNQKGGVGKTTVSINLAAALGKLGKRTLLVDLDPQGNTSTGLGINKSDINGKSTYECLTGAIEPRDAVLQTRFTNLYVMPATINLAGIDNEYHYRMATDKSFKMNEQLKLVLDEIKRGFDYIIIDCPPNLGVLTINALAASNKIIIPVQCEFFALDGVTQLLDTILRTQKAINPRLQIEGVLLTMLDSRTNLGMEVVEDVRRFFGSKTFDTIIPRLIRLVEAPSHGEPINVYDPDNRATLAFENLAKEVLMRDERE